MPRIVTVSEVRQAIAFESGLIGTDGGAPATALLGRLFHDTFARLTGTDPGTNLVAPLQRADRSPEAWEAALHEHTYLWIVGPQLVAHQTALQEATTEVGTYWRAVTNLAGWLCRVLWEQAAPGEPLESARRALFAGSEVDCQVELEDPAWTDSVVLQGRLDALLTQPASGQVCAVELKLGRSRPQADLAQACLYHLILTEGARERGEAPPDRLALWTFQPESNERLWSAEQAREAQGHLKAVVGRLAGVLPPTGRPADPTRPPEPGRRPPPPAASTQSVEDLKSRLVAAFKEFGTPIHLDDPPLVGPRFYRFWGTPVQAANVKRILAASDSLWTRLRTPRPPQLSLEGGRVAIDVQREDAQRIPWGDVPLARTDGAGCSRFPVGQSITGEWRWADFADPEDAHVLVAGTNGSGKSVWLKALVAGLCGANTPATLKLVLIDPKRTAFGPLAGSPFLLQPIVHPPDQSPIEVLDALIEEMEARYGRFQQAGVNDLREWQARGLEPLPRVICVCDEYADLVLADARVGREVERRVGRIGAKGRAAGIHLALATQRPSRDLVTGVIKANMNARVALRVNSAIESKLILEGPGAELLLGHGDLLFKDLGEPVRLQAPWITDEELKQSAAVPSA